MLSNWHEKKKETLVSIITILLTVTSLAPLIFPPFFASEISSDYHRFFKIFLVVIPIGAVVLCYKVNINCLPNQKVALFILVILLSAFLVDIHYIYIDKTSNYFKTVTNHYFQLRVHRHVMNLDPDFIPHSYRFLPNSMVRIVEFLSGDFSYARSLYRHTLMFLLLFSIYYYARIYHSHEKALLTILFYAMVYPISIRYYAGQLTDPLSHLSFVLTFIFLELNLFIYFGLTVFIGILAKESLLVMVLYFLLFRWKEKGYFAKTLFLFFLCILITMCIRLWIVPAKSYINDIFVIQNLKGTALPHIITNIKLFHLWGRQLLFTVGIFIPFLILAWKSARPSLRDLAVFLLVTLLFSNVFFGWLQETRNLIPAVIPLAVITSDYLLSRNQRTV